VEKVIFKQYSTVISIKQLTFQKPPNIRTKFIVVKTAKYVTD